MSATLAEPHGTRGKSAAPLAGVRVLDLSRLLPGPMCTLYLAQLGADVIKVEDTGPGDYARVLGSAREPSAFYTLVNRGKRSIAIDLKQAAGRDAFMALARTADVIVESFRPGVVRSLGIGHENVRTANARLVYASISGYGQDGPRAHAAGHDINYLGYAGVLDQMGARNRPPALSNVQIADLLGGAAMPAVAILAALFDAQRTGVGRYIDVAMADASLAHNVFSLASMLDSGAVPRRGDAMLTGGVPCYGVYATKDGRHLAVGALEEKFWRALCESLRRPDLLPFGQARGEDGERTREALASIFAAQPLEHWTRHFADVDCCVTPVLDVDEALRDRQFIARGMVQRDASGEPWPAPPFRLSNHAVDATAPAPRQGEHTHAILREIGYDEDAIAALFAARTVIVRDAV